MYDDILKMFVSEDTLRPQFLKPFFIDNLAIATDAHSLVFFDKNLCDENLLPFDRKPESVLSVIPKERNENFLISIESLKSAISKCPLIDEMKDNKKTCNACYGEGDVEYVFEYGGMDYELEHECPVCDGEGTIGKDIPTGNKITDKDAPIKIKHSCFSVNYISKLIRIAETLGEDKIFLTLSTGKHNITVFKIKNVELLLMPLCIENGEKDVIEL